MITTFLVTKQEETSLCCTGKNNTFALFRNKLFYNGIILNHVTVIFMFIVTVTVVSKCDYDNVTKLVA